MCNNYSNIIIKNTSFGILFILIDGLVSLLAIPILIGSLGIELYGLWITILQPIMLLAATDIGISSSAGRFIAKYQNERDKYIINARVIFFIIAFIVFCISPIIIYLFNNTLADKDQIYINIIILILFYILDFADFHVFWFLHLFFHSK